MHRFRPELDEEMQAAVVYGVARDARNTMLDAVAEATGNTTRR
jgi:hypothetical protein